MRAGANLYGIGWAVYGERAKDGRAKYKSYAFSEHLQKLSNDNFPIGSTDKKCFTKYIEST